MERTTLRAFRQPIDANEVPPQLRNMLYVLLVGGGLVSLPFIGSYSPLPTTTLLDAWIVVFMVASILRGKISTNMLLLFLGLYLLTRVVPAIATASPLYDFVQAYKWVLYLIAFALAVGRKWGPIAPLVRVMWALLVMAVGKAIFTFIILGSGERPGLLLENNFELALFCGLVAVAYRHLGRGGIWAIMLVGVLTILASSRSGAIAFVLVVIFAASQMKAANLFIRYLVICAIPVVGFIAVSIFIARSASGRRIDRLKFLDVFVRETDNWTPLTWLAGTTPITPVSPGGCSQLSFYQNLFSSVGDGSCYSVIFHAFLLRVLFDAGIVGLVISLGITWYTIRKAKVQFAVAATLMTIAFTNGLSVSGLNNPYVALPILLAIVTASVPPPSSRTPARHSLPNKATFDAGPG